jgi:thymidylate kinase
MTGFSRQLTIFEGADGSGKSTLAKKYAEATGARYIHFPALPRVNKGLARMYVEAMLPALLGYQDVVFDRCWLSEIPYGTVFREGQDRLGNITIRMLERLAMRCDGRVVYCNPPLAVVKQNYRSRKQLEMLDNEDQLEAVYKIYDAMIVSNGTMLNWETHDYTKYSDSELAIERLATNTISVVSAGHPLHVMSAGNLHAPVVLVGQDFAERKDQDSFYQWPFASFSRDGCSHWLTRLLDEDSISERDLLWVNVDQQVEDIIKPTQTVIALGNKASQRLHSLDIDHIELPHPQYVKRFNESYRLVSIIKEILQDGR